MNEASADELIARYREAARLHEAASFAGDSVEGNASADVIASIYAELRRRGLQSSVLVLLDDPDLGVRGWAGAHALEFAPDQGEAALSALASEPGLIAFNAETTLAEWRGGRLRFP